MADLDGYKQWLAKQQRQPAFLNNHWCLMLSYGMETNKLSTGFNIPYFIVEEQLTKEDDNVNLENKDDAYISPALRQWLIDLLKLYDDSVNVNNYEEVLRDFLEKDGTLPIGIARPLTASSSFHNLPSECKLWILYALWSRKTGKPSKPPQTATKDPLGNSYHMLPTGRLYVRIAKAESGTLPIDEERLKHETWASLYRFVHEPSCKLLCDNQDSWEVVWKAFLSFKLNNLYNSINSDMSVRLMARSSILISNEINRAKFETEMTRMAPIPSARQINKGKSSFGQQRTFDVNGLQTHLEVMNLNGSSPPATAKPNQQSRKKVERCREFPQCQNGQLCPYSHPKNRCKNFPNCSYGWQCLFLHEFSPNDQGCVEPNCAYEHVFSRTTYYRLPRVAESGPTDAENPKPIASVSPLKKIRSDNSIQGAPDGSTPPVTSGPQQNPGPTKTKRCQYFPQCKNGDACPFVHPAADCRNFPLGRPCPGQWCLFKHGPCPNDGTCRDMKCAYEHYKSKPVVMRKQAAKKRQGTLSRAPSQSNLSRAPSMSNLSTYSGRSRRKSCASDYDSDDDSCSKKNSTEKSPVGILRHSERPRDPCRFGSSCTRKATCRYQHPTEKCPAFPKCPNGGICNFLHSTCKNDGVCSKVNCDYAHDLDKLPLHPHEVGNSWCKNGSRCTRVACRFIHPEECNGPCPAPGDCWMYHRPAAAPFLPPPRGPPRPGYGQGPGYGPSPGFPPMPPFMPPPPPQGVRYGFGPDSVYRRPEPPYGMRPGAGPGYPRAAFQPQPGPGDYRPRPNNVAPARPTTPGPSSPPSYADLSAVDREKRDRLG